MKKSFKTVLAIAVVVAAIFTVASCVNVLDDGGSIGNSSGSSSGDGYNDQPEYIDEPLIVYDTIEDVGTEKYTFVASYGDDIFGLTYPKLAGRAATSDFVLTQLDPETYEPIAGTSVNVNGINPSSLFVDDEFVYISSIKTDNGCSPLNKVLVFDKNNLSSVSQIGNGWNNDSRIYHPVGVGSDENNIYIVSGKTGVVRVHKKENVRENWGKMRNAFEPSDAYVKLPVNAPHNNDGRATVYAKGGLVLITFSGHSYVYKFDVNDIHNGRYTEWDNAKAAEDTLPIPFGKTALNNIVVNNGYASLQLGDKIFIMEEEKFMEEAKFKRLDFSDYLFALSSNTNEFSIVTTKKIDDAFTVYTCEKDSTIKKTVPLVVSISTVDNSTKLTEILDSRLLAKRDETFKPQDRMTLKSQYKIRLRQPIESAFDNGKLVIRSFYMKNLYGAKFAIKIKGMNDDEVIVLDFNEPISPFQEKTYKMPILTEGGIFKTVNGSTVQVTKLNPANIVSTRIIHNDNSLEKINNLASDWSISFSGEEGKRYIGIEREDARNYIQTYTNMAYAFESPVMNDCLDHFTYFTRAVFIEDVAGISDSTQTKWYHLDVDDPYYNASNNDKKRFLERVGVTDKWLSHWGLSIDTVQVGVASSGGSKGGGWLALSRGAFNQSGEDVVTYILAHEFGHSRGWQHGSSFAYGAFSDRANNSRQDYITDMLSNVGKTLLHMGVLPYTEQFKPSAYDYMELDQIEAKVYLSGRRDWWSAELWDHVQNKVNAINAYADGIDNGRIAERALITTRMDELQAHLDAFVAKTGRPVSNHDATYSPWRAAVQADKKFSWITNRQWDRMNQTFRNGDPVGVIRTEALNAIAGTFDRSKLLNKWNFTNNTAFTIIREDNGNKGMCHHPGHNYADRYFAN